MPPPSAERLCLSGSDFILRTRLRLGWFNTEAEPQKSKRQVTGKANPYRTVRRRSRSCTAVLSFAVLLVSLVVGSCTRGERRSGIPADAQAVLDTAIEDINAGDYDKLYNAAADEWRRDTTLEGSKATFERLREKLGRATVRSLQTAREEQTGTAPVAGHSLVAIYQTSFERGHAMETFTLVERGGKWYLAKYFVSSTALG